MWQRRSTLELSDDTHLHVQSFGFGGYDGRHFFPYKYEGKGPTLVPGGGRSRRGPGGKSRGCRLILVC
jgi:hypothetical protein